MPSSPVVPASPTADVVPLIRHLQHLIEDKGRVLGCLHGDANWMVVMMDQLLLEMDCAQTSHDAIVTGLEEVEILLGIRHRT